MGLNHTCYAAGCCTVSALGAIGVACDATMGRASPAGTQCQLTLRGSGSLGAACVLGFIFAPGLQAGQACQRIWSWCAGRGGAGTGAGTIALQLMASGLGFTRCLLTHALLPCQRTTQHAERLATPRGRLQQCVRLRTCTSMQRRISSQPQKTLYQAYKASKPRMCVRLPPPLHMHTWGWLSTPRLPTQPPRQPQGTPLPPHLLLQSPEELAHK